MGATGSRQGDREELWGDDQDPYLYSSESEPLLKPVQDSWPPLVLLPPIPHSLFDYAVLWIRSYIAQIFKIIKRCFGFDPAYSPDARSFINELKCKNDISIETCIDNDRRKGFDRSSSDHLQMLTMLWKCLKPTESHPDDDDFSLLGFQNGLRPETDLRGMGILALHHLVFFAECATDRALGVMAASEATYFPFAATGVTFTALCVRLLNEGRLDEPLLKAYSDRLEKGGDKSTTPDPNEEGMRLIDGLYVELYAAFGDFWFWKRPASIMEFPKLYRQFEDHINMCLPASRCQQSNEQQKRKERKKHR